MITRSTLDTEYLTYPVSFIIGGVSQNPTGDTVAFAFMPNPANTDPGVSDWHTGQWITTGTGTYQAQILLGPANGGLIPAPAGPGLWNVWVRITDNPEVPVQMIDLLQLV